MNTLTDFPTLPMMMKIVNIPNIWPKHLIQHYKRNNKILSKHDMRVALNHMMVPKFIYFLIAAQSEKLTNKLRFSKKSKAMNENSATYIGQTI